MNRVKKLDELRATMSELEVRRGKSQGFGTTPFPSCGINLATSSGNSRYFEYAGAQGRNDNQIAPPDRETNSYEHMRELRAASGELDNFLAGLSVPELRDEFASAVAKIAKKAQKIKSDARYLLQTSKPDGVTAQRIKDRWEGNSLFELELDRYNNSSERRTDLSSKARQLMMQLGVFESLGLEDDGWNYPTFLQVNDLYHQALREQKAAPKND